MLHDLSKRTPPRNLAEIAFQTAYHYVEQHLVAANGNAAAKALRVEHLKQCGKTIGVTVVRRRGKEKSVFELLSQLPHHSGEVGVDGVATTARGSGIVRFIKNE